MPTYAFECPNCENTVEEFCKREERDLPFVCPECLTTMNRVPIRMEAAPVMGFIPGAEFVNKSTGERKDVDGLFNKSHPRRKK